MMSALMRLALVFACVASASLHAQPLSAPILIGFTSSLSGSHADYGQGLLHGARVAVTRANAAGGVGGRPLELLVLDDAGDHQRAAANARRLLDSGVVAITGVHGARATAAVAAGLVTPGGEVAHTALVAPATGADSLRDPPRPGVFHLRAGVAEEASAAVLHLDTVGISRYALITQDDALGESGHERVMFELTRIAIRPVTNLRVPAGASSAEVRRVLVKACEALPEALILAVDAAAATAAIQEGKARRCAAQYVVFSETGAALATRESSAAGPHPLAGVLVTQVVPHPGNRMHPLVAEYQRALTAQGANAGTYPSLEGYLAMRVLQEGLSGCAKDANRACLLRSLRAGSFDLPGLRIQFGTTQRQASPFVEITLLDGQGRFRR